MIVKKTLLNSVPPFYRNTHRRISLFAAAGCVVGGLLASSGAWAGELTEAPAPAQVAALEPDHQQPQLVHSIGTAMESIRLAPVPSEAALKIDLEEVTDMASIVDEARKQAQVEYLAEKLRQPPQTLKQYVELAWREASRRVGLEPGLLIAIMQKESVFRPKVQSSYGAQGLMQVVRRWHREKLHASESLFDPAVNIRVGTDILEEYLELAEGDLSKALAKYSGNARGYASTVMNESRKLEQVADLAAAQVTMAPGVFESPSAGNAG